MVSGSALSSSEPRQATGDRSAELRADLAAFEHLVAQAEAELARGRPVDAAVRAQVAATYAFWRHPGRFASPRLERLLAEIGRRYVPPMSTARPAQQAEGWPRTVIHVSTRVAGIGGHSRMIWRWIQQDSSRRHSVILTRQGAMPVPRELHEAVRAKGGNVRILNRQPGNIISWAQSLREQTANADLVVLHLFADDVVPLIAFAGEQPSPRVAFLDHADHAFWLGSSVTDLYIPMREAGRRLAESRRHIDPQRTELMPIILNPIRRTLSREEAKRELGLPPESTLLLSIARAPKYRPLGKTPYFAMFEEAIRHHPDLHLWVIGPTPDAGWNAVAAETGGRIRCFPERTDTATFYQAADVYVDSFPAGSNTSLLEAGSYGLPLLSRCLVPGECTILCSDAPGLSQHMLRTADEGEYAAALSRLINDEDYRLRLGAQTQLAIAALHREERLQEAIERVYRHAAEVPLRPGPPADSDVEMLDEVDQHWSDLFRFEASVEEIERVHMKGLPTANRARLWFDMLARGQRPGPNLLLPEWATARAKEWRATSRSWAGSGLGRLGIAR